MQTPVESLINQVQGYRMLRNAFRGPEAQQNASRVLAALRGDKAGAPTKGINMNGFLVDPITGEQMGDFRTPDQRQGKENERYGDAFEHPQLGWVQPGPNGQLKQMDAAGANNLTPTQDADLERVGTRFGALQKLEYAVMTNQLDGQDIGIPGVGLMTINNENREEVLKYLQDAKANNEREYNSILGRNEPTPVETSIVERAQQVPEADRGEFLADLKANPRTPYRVVQQVEQMFGAGQPSPQNAQQAPQSAPSQQQQPGLQRPQPQSAPQPKPDARQSKGLPGPETETPNQPMGLRNPSEGVTFLQQKLGPEIEAGFEAVGDWYTGAKATERTKRRMTLMEIADGKKPFSGNRQALLQFLVKSRGEMRDLQPAQLKRLESQLGPELADRFLNAN
jgi:hypothetical protein